MGKRIEEEKKTVEFMIELYCKHKLKCKTMPPKYKELIDYAHAKLNKCTFGENKKSCKQCPIHCYSPQKREEIKKIMRWAGPRMIVYSPIKALKHLFRK